MHDIALARTSELRTDVLLIQELWWSDRTKAHLNFDIHPSFGGTGIRLWVATYVKKNSERLTFVQKYPSSPASDYC